VQHTSARFLTAIEPVMFPRLRGVGSLDRDGLVVSELVFGCGEHAKGGVTPLAVVEDLEVLEHGVGQLDSGPPVSFRLGGEADGYLILSKDRFPPRGSGTLS
jgi:hypothetical protein